MYFWRCVNTSVFMNHFHFVSFFQLFCPICSNFSTVFHYRFKILLFDCFQSNSLVCDPLSVYSRQCWCSSAPMNADAIELDDNFLFRITQAFFFILFSCIFSLFLKYCQQKHFGYYRWNEWVDVHSTPSKILFIKLVWEFAGIRMPLIWRSIKWCIS